MFASDEIDRTAEQASLLMPFGFTERQARFLTVVLLHSGIFMRRHYAAFAGITHGQKATSSSACWHDGSPRRIELGGPDARASSTSSTSRCTPRSANRTTATGSPSPWAVPSNG